MWVEQSRWVVAGKSKEAEIASCHFKTSGDAMAAAEEILEQGIDAEISVIGAGTLAIIVFDVLAFHKAFPKLVLH